MGRGSKGGSGGGEPAAGLKGKKKQAKNGKATAVGGGKSQPGSGKSSAVAKGMSKGDYLDALLPLQVELNRAARWLEQSGRRLLVIVEGRDTAGKGGAISAISERLNPRRCHVVALGVPSEREAGQWYFQRYMASLPAAGEITLFDRSWYNRAGVEAVMGFCTPAQTDAFLAQAPRLEKLLADDGLLILKYWLCVDQVQQEARFAERLADPLKRWKLSPIDLKARDHYVAYGQARDRMLKATHIPEAPWTLVDFNDQRRGRLALIRHLLAQLPIVLQPEDPFVLPPLQGLPQREKLAGRFTPI